MLFHAKNNTAKLKGTNLFSYSVSVMSQIVSTKRVLALVRVKLWPPIFPQKSIATEIILTAKKVYLTLFRLGGGLFEPPLRQNRDNSYTERAMAIKFSDFS